MGRYKPGPAPSIQYVMSLQSQAESESEMVRHRWRDIQQVRDGTYRPNIPEKFASRDTHLVRTKRVADTLNRVISTVTRNFPTVSVPPAGPSQALQDLSTKKEEFLNASLQELDAASEPDRAFMQAMDYQATYGAAWWKLVYTPDSWWDYPTARATFGKRIVELTEDEAGDLESRRDRYKHGRLPFRLSAPDPMTVWGFYQDRELSEIVEVTERPITQIAQRYGVRYVPDGDGGHLEPGAVGQPFEEGKAPGYNQTITFVEHWDRTWVTYVAGNTILAQWKHGYRRVPYFPFYGLTQYTRQPGARGASIIENVLDQERELDALLSMKRNWAELSAWPMGVIIAKDGNAMPLLAIEGTGDQQSGPAIEFEPGKFKNLPPGWDFRWLEAPPVGRDLTEMIAYLDQALREVVPNVMKGVASGDNQPAYAIYLLTTAARLVYDPLTDNAAVSLTRVVEFYQWLIEHRVKEVVYALVEQTKGDTVTRRWTGIGPDDLKGYYKNTVNMAALLPSNRQMEVQMGLSLYQAGAITWKTLLEDYVHKPDPEREIRAKVVERTLYDPASPLYGYIVQEALDDAKVLREIKKQQQAAELANVQEPLGVQEMMGAPVGPGGPMPPGGAGLPPPPGAPGGMPIVPPIGPQMPGTVGAGAMPIGPGGPGTGMGNLPGAGLPQTVRAPGGGLEGGPMPGLP